MRMIFLAAALCALAPGADAAPLPHWVASWGTAQMDPGPEAPPPAQWNDVTLRQVVHVTLAARTVRVRFSNAFGTEPLAIDAASLALVAADTVPASMRLLRFGGSTGVVIPAGAEYASDPVELPHAAGADLAVALHLAAAPSRITGHPGAGATSFIAPGNHVRESRWPAGGTQVGGWFQLAAIEVLADAGAHSVAAIGDSITDGYGSTVDGNDRWPDVLAARLRAAGMGQVGVVNAGITGNRLLRDGRGPNLAGRFARDVLARAGVSHVIVMIGVNDFGMQHRDHEDTPAARAALLAALEAAHRQLAAQAHARGICVLGATITPYAGGADYRPSADNESDRQTYNDWIRNAGVFDGVIDFDAALRDPGHPQLLRAAFDNDGLHPSVPGYRAMAAEVPLESLAKCVIKSH